MENKLIETLLRFGATKSELLFFNKPHVEALDYLDLITSISEGEQSLPSGVVETETRPVLYFIDSTNLSTCHEESLKQIEKSRRILACRGDGASLGIIEPGQITLVPCSFEPQPSNGHTIRCDEPRAERLLRDLAMGATPKEMRKFLSGAPKEKRMTVHRLLFNLLNHTTKELLTTEALKNKHETVLALVGRALFTRFLLDRKILNKSTFPELYQYDPKECFGTPELAALTCNWLDKTFNGELLPIPCQNYSSEFSSYDVRTFNELSKILCHANAEGQMSLNFGWNDVNFAHVPVGLLSEVYEQYAHKYFEKSAKNESIHYTPHHIAAFMIFQAFEGIETAPRHKAKVLDPSAGAGVFLVLAFRRLIAEEWRSTGVRPNTKKIRHILNSQIFGFDINSAALKLTALSLYLTALELDPDPFPPETLRFTNLIEKNLIMARQPGEEFPEFPVLGSLGQAVGEEHNGQYDLIIGNPPWTAWKPSWINKKATKLVKDIASRRHAEILKDVATSYHNPDNVPDLPFVWRSLEWAKEGGIIAFALHARLLFKKTNTAINARNQLMKAVKVTGILNGAGLRQTEVWPDMTAPFCILFAKNELPDAKHVFRFVSPQHEKELNKQSKMRIDYLNAEPIQPKTLETRKTLLKTLFRGTALDADIIYRIDSMLGFGQKGGNATRLIDYWINISGKSRHGQGYQRATKAQDASFLINMNAVKLTKKEETEYYIDTRQLDLFNIQKLQWPRKKTIYETPLLIVTEAPGLLHKSKRARLCLDKTPIAYNESFYGFSFAQTKHPKEIAKYLFLLLNSDLFIYYALMTSSKYGVERESLHFDDYKTFPVIPYDKLDQKQKQKIEKINHSFSDFLDPNFKSLNNFVYDLYDIAKPDIQTILDTLSVSAPESTAKKLAEKTPTPVEINTYNEELTRHLLPFFKLNNDTISIEQISTKIHSWIFINISNLTTLNKKHGPTTQTILEKIATANGSSRIQIKEKGSLTIGMPAKYRYWTKSRARLLSMEILQTSGDIF